MAFGTRLVEVPEEEPIERTPLRLSVPDPHPETSAAEKAEIALGKMLMLSFKALSQQTLASLVALADLLLIGSAFVLWFRVMPDPSQLQLTGLSLYAMFILISLFVRRRVAK